MSKLKELLIDKISHDGMEDADYQYAQWLIAQQANDESKKRALHVSRISRAMDREEELQSLSEQILQSLSEQISQEQEQHTDREIPNWLAAAY